MMRVSLSKYLFSKIFVHRDQNSLFSKSDLENFIISDTASLIEY